MGTSVQEDLMVQDARGRWEIRPGIRRTDHAMNVDEVLDAIDLGGGETVVTKQEPMARLRGKG